MTIPFEPKLLGIAVPVHLILEYLAFFVAYRYYLYLRKNERDTISNKNRLSLVIGAIVGAFVGSRLVGYLENPTLSLTSGDILQLLTSTKTIMGGLFGGLIGVEAAKKIIREDQSSGDLFTLPIIVGLFIGRIGCFLSGVHEFTYGSETSCFTGMDLGDGWLRHPTSLYELAFLLVLYLILHHVKTSRNLENGMLFKLFMLSYFSFRFLIEFIKPNVFFLFGLSSIQWLCVVCWVYYSKTISKSIKNAYQTIHLL